MQGNTMFPCIDFKRGFAGEGTSPAGSGFFLHRLSELAGGKYAGPASEQSSILGSSGRKAPTRRAVSAAPLPTLQREPQQFRREPYPHRESEGNSPPRDRRTSASRPPSTHTTPAPRCILVGDDYPVSQ